MIHVQVEKRLIKSYIIINLHIFKIMGHAVLNYFLETPVLMHLCINWLLSNSSGS